MTTKSAKFSIKACTKCPHHKKVNDRDPEDWFNDDDMAILCTKMKPLKSSIGRAAGGEPFEFRPVTVSCRPYQATRETTPPPKWCPLRK